MQQIRHLLCQGLQSFGRLVYAHCLIEAAWKVDDLQAVSGVRLEFLRCIISLRESRSP